MYRPLHDRAFARIPLRTRQDASDLDWRDAWDEANGDEGIIIAPRTPRHGHDAFNAFGWEDES